MQTDCDKAPKTPSPPSSVAAALRSRVPTGANAERITLSDMRHLNGAADHSGAAASPY
jgi:hypothetical protein